MKSLSVNSDNFRYLEKSFGEWLDILGYAQRTVTGFPLHLREFFHFMETRKHITHLAYIKPRHVTEFFAHLRLRGNKKLGGGLSASTINGYVSAG